MPVSRAWGGWAAEADSGPGAAGPAPAGRRAPFAHPRGVAAVGALVLAVAGAVASVGWGGGGRDELLVLGPLGVGEPWVLSGGAEGILGQLSFDHQRAARERRLRARHAKGREQQLTEQAAGAVTQPRKASPLPRRAKAAKLPGRKGASALADAAEGGGGEKEGGEYVPDYPETKTVQWHAYEEEENPFADLEDTKHEWKGQEPEENVFAKPDDTTEDVPAGEAAGGGGAAGAAGAEPGGEYVPDDPRTKTVQWRAYEGEDNAFDDLDTTPHEYGTFKPERNVFNEAGAAEEGEDAEAQAREIATLKAKLAQAKRKVMLVERDGGHAWRRQRPIENVLNDVFPHKEYVWRKQKEVLPNVWARLPVAPVKWHAYTPEKPNWIGFLSQKKYAWRGQAPEENVLDRALPTGAHKWRGGGGAGEYNALDGLPDGQHKWAHSGLDEYNVLDELPTAAHEWGAQQPPHNVLNGLSTEEHVWHRQTQPHNVYASLNSAPHEWRRDVKPPHNVLDALPGKPYEWSGPHLRAQHQLDALSSKKQAWHAYRADTSPLSSLPATKYAWRGPGLKPARELDGVLPIGRAEWHAQAPEHSPIADMKLKPYTWKGPGKESDGMFWPAGKKYEWRGPGGEKSPLDDLPVKEHAWHAQKPAHNVLGYLPTYIPDRAEEKP